MDAIILVGGQGTRLRPLTAARHKSLVPVCNRPAITYLFEWLRTSGIERVILAIGQNNEDLAEAFPEGRDHGFELRHIVEKQRLESGGAIRNAVQTAGIDDTFVVLNGDIYVDFDFQEALRAHRAASADLSLALAPVDDPSDFGVAVLDDDGFVTGFVEKPPHGEAPSNLVNAGAWIFEREIVDQIPAGAVRVEETLFPSLVARRRPVLGYCFDGTWADIGTTQRYLDLNLQLLHQRGEAAIAASAKVAAEGHVERSAIGDGTCVEQGASIVDSVVWDECQVGRDASVWRSILADSVTVGAGAHVEGSVIGRGAVVESGAVVPPGTILEPGTRYDADDGR